MEMTQSLLWLCLALAAIGLLVLAFALRRLVAAANNRSASGAWLLAAGGVLTAGLWGMPGAGTASGTTHSRPAAQFPTRLPAQRPFGLRLEPSGPGGKGEEGKVGLAQAPPQSVRVMPSRLVGLRTTLKME